MKYRMLRKWAPADSSDYSATPNPDLLLTMKHIRKLPHVERVTQLKCIEGWIEMVDAPPCLATLDGE
jgi:hypothetical protein